VTVVAVCTWQIECETRREFDHQRSMVDEHPKVERVVMDADALRLDADVSLTYEV